MLVGVPVNTKSPLSSAAGMYAPVPPAVEVANPERYNALYAKPTLFNCLRGVISESDSTVTPRKRLFD